MLWREFEGEGGTGAEKVAGGFGVLRPVAAAAAAAAGVEDEEAGEEGLSVEFEEGARSKSAPPCRPEGKEDEEGWEGGGGALAELMKDCANEVDLDAAGCFVSSSKRRADPKIGADCVVDKRGSDGGPTTSSASLVCDNVDSGPGPTTPTTFASSDVEANGSTSGAGFFDPDSALVVGDTTYSDLLFTKRESNGAGLAKAYPDFGLASLGSSLQTIAPSVAVETAAEISSFCFANSA